MFDTMLNFIEWDTIKSEPGPALAVSHEQQLPAPYDGGVWIKLKGTIDKQTLALVDGVPTEVDKIPPLEVALGLKWNAAKDYRELRKSAGCMTPKGRIQTRDIPTKNDRGNIGALYSGALGAKLTGQPFSANVTMENNEEIACSADDVIAIGNAMAAYIQACQDRGTAIRKDLEAAAMLEPTSAALEAIAAIDITAGYPTE